MENAIRHEELCVVRAYFYWDAIASRPSQRPEQRNIHEDTDPNTVGLCTVQGQRAQPSTVETPCITLQLALQIHGMTFSGSTNHGLCGSVVQINKKSCISGPTQFKPVNCTYTSI